MITQILLDMDGVLASFVQGALKLHGWSEEEPPCPCPWEMEKVLGISVPAFWKKIDSTPGFWQSLPETSEAEDFVRTATDLVGEENVAILTAPSLSADCFLGKRDWIGTHFPRLQGRIIYGKAKQFLASPSRLLVDDKPENCEAFTAAGGHSILVPRPWNRDWSMSSRALEVVLGEMTEKVRHG